MNKKILQIVDVPNWAIGRLAKPIVTFNPHFDWRCISVHPKAIERNEVDLKKIKEDIEWADIIDAQYWRTLSQLADKIPLIRAKKVVLTHHNEKNLLSADWGYVDVHIAKTKFSQAKLEEVYKGKVTLIHNSFNPDIFQYNDSFPPKEKMVGYVGRIVPWKGLKNILKACYELDVKCLLMGKMDKPNYWAEIPEEHKAMVDWSYFDCDDKDIPNYYKEISVYVGNSGSGREVGTLGVIEALASGVPVVSTPSGIINDIGEDDKNMVVVDYDDYLGLKEGIRRVLEHPQVAERLRKAGWQTIKGFNDERMAMEYRKVFNRLIFDPASMVSVIIPATYSSVKEVIEILKSLQNQTLKNFEVIVVWDEVKNEKDYLMQEDYSLVLKQLWTGKEVGYNLAMARNLGVIESDGKYLLFCDSRLAPEPEAIQGFFQRMIKDEKLKWLFGEKGGNKPHFVENFSFTKRGDLIKSGMFNERITEYGGMSQELRERFMAQGYELVYCPEVKAKQLRSGRKDSNRYNSIIKMKNLLQRLYG